MPAHTLVGHEKTHDNMRLETFFCECDKSFLTKAGLDTHKKIHEEEKTKFHCNFCDKNFKYSYTLKSHMKSHISVKNPLIAIYVTKVSKMWQL